MCGNASAIIFVGQFSGNDTTAGNPAVGVITALGTGLTQLKVDSPGTANGLLSVAYEGGAPSVRGTWSFMGSSDPTLQLAGLSVKAGNDYNLYEFTGAMTHTPGTDLTMQPWSTETGTDFNPGASPPGVITAMTTDTVGLQSNPNNFRTISHLSLWLKSAPSTGVPDGGTSLILLGMALLGLVPLRKSLAK